MTFAVAVPMYSLCVFLSLSLSPSHLPSFVLPFSPSLCSPADGSTLDIFLSHSPPYFLRQGLSVNIKLSFRHDGLTVKPQETACLPVSAHVVLELQACITTLTVTWVLRYQFGSSCLPSRHFFPEPAPQSCFILHRLDLAVQPKLILNY